MEDAGQREDEQQKAGFCGSSGPGVNSQETVGRKP